MSQKDAKPVDFSNQIASELNQLMALGECLKQMEASAEVREDFFMGLSEMIQGSADRIKTMLDPMYAHCSTGKIRAV